MMLQYLLLSLIYTLQKLIHQYKRLVRQSDNVFEAISGVAGQPLALAAATQVLAVRTTNVNVPLLPLTTAACPCTYLSTKENVTNRKAASVLVLMASLEF